MSQRDRNDLGNDVRKAAGLEPRRSSESVTTRPANERSAPFATIGLVTGILGLVLATFSPWILGALAAADDSDDGNAIVFESVDEEEGSGSWIERAKRWKVKLTLGAGPEHDEERDDEASAAHRAGKALPPVTLGLGLIGIVFGIVGLIRRERSLIGGLALLLGTAALVVQLTVFLVGLVVFALVVFGVLGMLGLAPAA